MANTEESAYLALLASILERGHCRETRNARTYSTFGERLVFDMVNGFPLLTTKKMFIRGIFEELIFFLNGKTNTKELEDRGVMIWHENTTQEFMEANAKQLAPYEIGPMYGFQWRHYGAAYADGMISAGGDRGLDQLAKAVDTLARDPYSRRILISTYNPLQAEEGVLYPCHGLTIQFYVEPPVAGRARISLQMYQRSADAFLGMPFNIASYAALLHIIVELVNNHPEKQEEYEAGRVIMVFGDTHVYADHVGQIKIQLGRHPRPFPSFSLRRRLASVADLAELQASDMVVSGYACQAPIRAKMVP